MARRSLQTVKNVELYFGLVAASGIILIFHHYLHLEFLLHLAAIPLDILIAVLIVERYLENHEQKEKRRQLMYIKSFMFRSEMRNLFITNVHALKTPALTMTRIKAASVDELRAMRTAAEEIEYKSLEAMEPVIMEYVKAESVWHSFMERAIAYNFDGIFFDMIFILHFIYDVKLFKENNPEKLFILEAEKRDVLMVKACKVLHDGIKAFLDYAIELKTKQPAMFDEVMADYELTELIRGI
jgi:hypothetical protein